MDGDTSQDMRYAPPQAHVEDVVEGGATLTPARRLDRFWAAVIDMVIAIVLAVIAAFLLPKAWTQTSDDWWTPNVGSTLLGFALFLAVNGILLARRGQTVGKLMLGLRIVRPDGSPVGLARMLLARYGVTYVFAVVPAGQIFNVIDVLLIFRASRRCLHDQIADTIVVKG